MPCCCPTSPLSGGIQLSLLASDKELDLECIGKWISLKVNHPDTFSGWVEAFPTKKETSLVMAKKILEDIFPRFGIPKVIGSDNGSTFIAQLSQEVARFLGLDCKLHCAYRPQSSGHLERMNRTLKEILTKLNMETGGDKAVLLPLALFRVRNTLSI
ncbi:pol protein [Echinococcus multilocularis]|uniref:Pol protein n=1 Tax=Echinococcus multilocularis TaxID=6211 RepID=A0A068Y0K7_ECHMU|nr:pol protein [Echinococcus multilocularis]